MKKEITTIKYYCDFCGEECEHTPDYILPEFEKKMTDVKNKQGDTLMKFPDYKIIQKQKDICPNCEEKVAMLLPLVKNMAINERGTYNIEIKL